MKFGGKNKHKSKIGDWHNRTGPALFGGVGGGSKLEELEEMRYLYLTNGWPDLNEIWYLEGSCALKLSF